MSAPPTRDGPRVNEEIRAPQVRLIDADGEMQGVMSARDAWLRAQAVGLDLLEISPNATLLRLHPSHRPIRGTLPPLRVSSRTSGSIDSHGVTGGVYKARERIHRGMLIRDY